MGKLLRAVGHASLWGLASIGAAVLIFVGGCTAGLQADGLDFLGYGGLLFAIVGFLAGGVYGFISGGAAPSNQ